MFRLRPIPAQFLDSWFWPNSSKIGFFKFHFCTPVSRNFWHNCFGDQYFVATKSAKSTSPWPIFILFFALKLAWIVLVYPCSIVLHNIQKHIYSENSRFISDSGFLDVCLFTTQLGLVYNCNCRVTRIFVGFFEIQILKLFVKNLIYIKSTNKSRKFQLFSKNWIFIIYKYFSQSEKKSDKWMITNYNWNWKWR